MVFRAKEQLAMITETEQLVCDDIRVICSIRTVLRLDALIELIENDY